MAVIVGTELTNVTVTKEFTFDCAHMLTGHTGLCKNLHGHTYKLQVEAQCRPVPVEQFHHDGMVVDFSDLKKIVNKMIISKLDHAFVYDIKGGDTELVIADLLHSNNMRIYGMLGRPTAEHMTRHFFIIMNDELAQTHASYRITKIRLWETPTSFAEYTG